MQHLDMVERVRALVRSTVAELAGETPDHFQETILIRDGFYCGRRFLSERMQAIWFIEEDEVKFSAVDGGVLLVCRASDGGRSSGRRAA